MVVMNTDFAQFVGARQVPLLRFAMVLTGDARLAEDIVADVLGRAFEQWVRIGAMEYPNAYVRRMIVNEYLSWRRRLWRSVPHAVASDQLDEASDHAHLHAERSAMMLQLAKLPRKQRTAVVMRYYEGWTDQQIAALLNCSAGAVRSNVSRGLAALRIELTGPTALRLSLTKET